MPIPSHPLLKSAPSSHHLLGRPFLTTKPRVIPAQLILHICLLCCCSSPNFSRRLMVHLLLTAFFFPKATIATREQIASDPFVYFVTDMAASCKSLTFYIFCKYFFKSVAHFLPLNILGTGTVRQ